MPNISVILLNLIFLNIRWLLYRYIYKILLLEKEKLRENAIIYA